MASLASPSSNRRTGRDRRAKVDAAIAADLVAALTRGEIEVCFQPQYAAADGRVVGAEALARWNHPRAGTIRGDQLFALATKAGRTTDVTRHLAEAALDAAAAWPASLGLSLNVTAADIAAADFVPHLLALLVRTGFAPARLTLEITEQSLVSDIDEATRRLDALAHHGIAIGLDDFGAGFCNFGYLKRLPLTALKLDRSMVEDIVEQPRDLAVLRAIVAMAQALGLKVIAEGIETEAQREAVVREGCSAWQGFLGAAPMSGEAFRELVG